MVVYAETVQQWLIALDLPPGTTVLEALQASGLFQHCPHLDLRVNRVGVHGQLVAPDTVLAPGDRVEIYRPLRNDPRERRRQRATTRRRAPPQ